MAEVPAADPNETKEEPSETPVWTPPPSGGTTEQTDHPIGQLDPEEEEFNRRSTGS